MNNTTSSFNVNVGQYIHIVFLSFVFIIGTIGNVMTIIAVRTERKLRKSVSNFFVINLAVADLIVCAAVVPLMIVHDAYAEQLFGPTTCYFTVLISGLACHATAATMTCIAVTRYVAALRATKYKDIIDKRKVCTVIFAVWIFASINTTPILIGWLGVNPEDLNTYVCVCFDGTFSLYYTLESVFIGHFLPHAVTVYCYFCVVGAIRRSRKRLESGSTASQNDNILTLDEVTHESDKQERKTIKSENKIRNSGSQSNLSVSNWSKHEIQLVKTSMWIIGFFSFCWIPSAILVILQNHAPLLLKKAFGSLCLLSFSLNPIIYGVMTDSFRKSYKKMFNKISCRSCNSTGNNSVSSISSSVMKMEYDMSQREMRNKS